MNKIMEYDKTYTFDDLFSWSSSDFCFAVIGNPISHSLSPNIHNYIFQTLAKTDKKFKKYKYFKFNILPSELKKSLQLFHDKKFLGINITAPYKNIITNYLKTNLLSVNTLKYNKNGWDCFSTDGIGFIRSLDDAEINFNNKNIILIGAGGAAYSIGQELLKKNCKNIWIKNRTYKNAKKLIDYLKGLNNKANINQSHYLTFKNPIVINTTSLGLKNDDSIPIILDKISKPIFVYDLIYNPAKTKLLKQAAKLNIKYSNGFPMLINQAIFSSKIWLE